MMANIIIEEILEEREAPNQIYPYILRSRGSELVNQEPEVTVVLRFVPLNALCVLKLDDERKKTFE